MLACTQVLGSFECSASYFRAGSDGQHCPAHVAIANNSRCSGCMRPETLHAQLGIQRCIRCVVFNRGACQTVCGMSQAVPVGTALAICSGLAM